MFIFFYTQKPLLLQAYIAAMCKQGISALESLSAKRFHILNNAHNGQVSFTRHCECTVNHYCLDQIPR